MIPPQRAAVRPRVHAPASGEPVLLEDEIRDLLTKGFVGRLVLIGPPGSGKTTALRHLAAVLPTEASVVLLDEPNEHSVAQAPSHGVMIFTMPGNCPWPFEASYRLADWTDDDLIEYLLSAHPKRCASVMARLRPADRSLLRGIPDLWQIVLERLASDDAIAEVRTALHHYLKAHLADTDLLERTRSACLNLYAAPDKHKSTTFENLAKPQFIKGLLRALRHEAMRLLLAAERVAADLHGDADCDFLARRLPRDLVRAAAEFIQEDARGVEHLHELLAGPPWSHAMAASLLHAAGVTWTPPPNAAPVLTGAYLDGVRWPQVILENARLDETALSMADLSQANLKTASAVSADLSGACLSGAITGRILALEVRLDRANLVEAQATEGIFQGASLRGAILDNALLERAVFRRADLTGASFRGANLARAILIEARIEGADFSGAALCGAWMQNLPLRAANLIHTNFKEAILEGSDLECVEMPRALFKKANLRSALLTDSVMPDSDFRETILCDAGLAGIEWERADLRGADLRGASFHLGSTRSGLVGSPIACEGSRTGFYTDDYEEQTHKAPEEIRKANLCGADLRGARLDGVDFYLVDLRGATYDPEQAQQFRRCGAILEARA
jgi:uncharacterized protein YjbI with pentapeptide repeats/energy-coupling factor transporter ATP-binding protein EcfA2